MIGVEKLTIRAVLLDFSAAFDIINHNLLLQKLKCYGLLQNTLFGELFNKQETDGLEWNFSEVKSVGCGIPQRSCLGPLLYSI